MKIDFLIGGKSKPVINAEMILLSKMKQRDVCYLSIKIKPGEKGMRDHVSGAIEWDAERESEGKVHARIDYHHCDDFNFEIFHDSWR